jgi:hypothetical protein
VKQAVFIYLTGSALIRMQGFLFFASVLVRQKSVAANDFCRSEAEIFLCE